MVVELMSTGALNGHYLSFFLHLIPSPTQGTRNIGNHLNNLLYLHLNTHNEIADQNLLLQDFLSIKIKPRTFLDKILAVYIDPSD